MQHANPLQPTVSPIFSDWAGRQRRRGCRRWKIWMNWKRNGRCYRQFISLIGKKFDFTSDRIRHTHVKREKVASTEMCTFLVLNISSLQLIPVTVIAYRGKYGSPDPTGIVEQPLWLRHFLRWRELSLQKIMSAADRKRGY